MAEYKNKRCKYLIAMGCLVQRYYNDLSKSMPEVDLFLKLEDYKKLWDKIEELLTQKRTGPNLADPKRTDSNLVEQLPMFAEQEYLARTVSTGENYAYLKIGEGCSNMCTYCAIPYIRGLFVSRPMEDILKEAEQLSKKGIKELIVIAHDTT